MFHALDLTVAVEGAHTYAPLFREAERLLPISDHWKQRLLELGAPPEKIEVRHMGVDTAALGYRPRTLPVGRAPRVISVGRFVEKKGFDYGLRAVARAEKLLGIESRIPSDRRWTAAPGARTAGAGGRARRARHVPRLEKQR